LILTAVNTFIIAVLILYAAITTTIVPGVAALYPATAFEVLFGIWFGVWGAIASYLGLLAAGLYAGWFPSPGVGAVLSVSDFLAAFLPYLVFKAMKADPELKSKRDWAAYILGGVILSSLPGSLYYNYLNLMMGQLRTWDEFWLGVYSWNVGNYIVVLVITTPLLKAVTRFIPRPLLSLRRY